MRTGVLIIGGGVAGLAAALAVPPNREVVVISETPLATGEIASSWAQGGVAAALAPDDSPRHHADDTVAAGAGLNDPAAVETLATEAPAAVEALIQLGVPFARNADGQLALGLEAAHNHRRIAHVADATGAAIITALTTAVRTRPNIHIIEGVRASRLLTDNTGAVTGALLVAPNGEVIVAAADAVILATGGFGGLFARTTTPLGARGSGIALAARAGAALADLEFIQFHPTALRIAADPLPLVSEAVRGEGALLLDERGERIMAGIDARMELAPRDIVARAVAAVERGGGTVVLDARTTIADRFPQRFPGIFATAMRAGIDPRRDPIPITAVAHYTIGGIATDLTGRTTLPGLWAAGEVAATGLHGANRLASNSLVEGLVFGARAGHDAGTTTVAHGRPAACAVPDHAATGDLTAALHPLRTAMTAGLGVVRDAAGITRALDVFTALERTTTDDRVADAAYVATAVAR
ncbi:MAG: L-aspartate oxidase, partial [Candidatus Eremiobacteraeota bacterium]|nr:L-aspartate oxidase [Candidatus Eremiobacteraeota bacterium]